MMIESDSDSESDSGYQLLQGDSDIITTSITADKQLPTAIRQEPSLAQKRSRLLEPPVSLNGGSLSHGSSIDSLLDEDDEVATTVQNKQLYLLVARCIAHPFNAKLHVETAPLKPKLSESMYECIRKVLLQCINQDKALYKELILNHAENKCSKNKDFQGMIEFYLNVILMKDDIKVICYRGCFSTKELENIFRTISFKHFRSLLLVQGQASSTENLTRRIETDPTYQVWNSTFAKLVEHGRQTSMTSKQRSEFNKQLTSMQMGNKEDMYKMFQEVLKVSSKDHQSFVQICQLGSVEEQEGVIRRELQKRREQIEKNIFPPFWNNQSHILKEHFVQEQARTLKILSENLESESLISSDFALKQRKKKTDESGGGAEPSKHDVHFNKKVKVTVRSLSQIQGISDDKPIFVVFDVADGDKPLATDQKEVSNGSIIYDTTGEFWTNSPLPQINLKVKIFTQGLLHEDKQVGKVLHTVMPTPSETSAEIPVTRDDKHHTPIATIKVATFLERPSNMRKCGNIYCKGDNMFKEGKTRFLALILLSQFRFLLCHYLPKDIYPRDIISLDGCEVDYIRDDPRSKNSDSILTEELPYGFSLSTPNKGIVKFACKTYNEREQWVNGLFRVTGQSTKPSDEQPGLLGSTSAAPGSELAEILEVDVTQLDHQQLFTKLFKDILIYRLDQQVFSRGLFSSTQMFIVDEYCARYGVRLSHRHLTCLREWLSCELRGISIWPVMILHSFGFCQMHIMGKAPQQHTEIVTPHEKQEWFELSGQLELLLTEKLENFRAYFPFSCPKDDLKITMKLFILVADINHCENGNPSTALITEKQPMKLLNQIMETAALNNFRQIYSKLWIQNEDAENENDHLDVEQIYVLAKLCIEFMYELHDFYNEDFILYPDAFSCHINAFWSFFLVDLKETMKFAGENDVIPLLKMFYSLNEYFILQPTLKLCPFHVNLLAMFETTVDDYLNGLDNSISNDMRAFFDNETWLPVSECCNSMKGCMEALESVKQFVENLHWPQEPYAGDLIFKVQSICADKFENAVRLARLQCEERTNNLTFGFDSVIPKPLISMINTLMFLNVQAIPFCGLSNEANQAMNRQSELSENLQSFLETTLGDVFRIVIHKLTEPLQVLLKQMARLDPQTGMLSTLKAMIPTSIQTENYKQFLKLNFEHFSGTLVTAVFNQFIFNWYETQLRILARWLRNRPDFSLHTAQLESVEFTVEIIREQFHPDEEDIEDDKFNSESYNEVEDRIKRENQQAALQKAFKKN